MCDVSPVMDTPWWGNPPLWFAHLGMKYLPFSDCNIAGLIGFMGFFGVLCLGAGVIAHLCTSRI